MATLRSIIRILVFVLYTVLIVFSALLLRLIGLPHRVVFSHFRWWRRLTAQLLHIQLHIEGSPPSVPCVFMANHRSYLDIALLEIQQPTVFVAKSSVRKWPLFGFGGDAMRTIWVNRDSKTSRSQTRKSIQERLTSGLSVVLFPEGTTSRGPLILAYRPGMFYTIAEANFPLCAVALHYEDSDIAWVDDDLFVPHLFQLFKKKNVVARLAFSPVRRNQDAQELKMTVEQWTKKQLTAFQQS